MKLSMYAAFYLSVHLSTTNTTTDKRRITNRFGNGVLRWKWGTGGTNGSTGVSFCSVSVLYRCNEHYTRQEASSDECNEMWLCYLLVYKTYLKLAKDSTCQSIMSLMWYDIGWARYLELFFIMAKWLNSTRCSSRISLAISLRLYRYLLDIRSVIPDHAFVRT